MSEPRPSEDGQTGFPEAEVGQGRESEDRPELPLEERLGRAADRFEARVQDWGQLGFETDLETRLDEMDKWEQEMQWIVDSHERARLGAVAFAERQMESEAEKKRGQAAARLKGKEVSDERREKEYEKAKAIGRNVALAHSGAALWWERSGNPERFHNLYEWINRQLMRVA
ncbi:MAG: hypothetical protein Q8Q11_02535 [bacterium]|nr:hypothetical protein [bacterium]MDZ4247996.1 hypothetical protein [Patescibacteria group bacterium]